MTPRKSIAASRVFNLCRALFPCFTKEDQDAASALANRRNDELHTGAAAFAQYPTSLWITGFYRACKTLAEAMGEDLQSLLGEDEAKTAEEAVRSNQNGVKQKVSASIAAHRKVFEERPDEERRIAAEQAKEQGEQLATQRHHRVVCPACSCVATLQGRPIGRENVEHVDDEIVVRQAVSPTKFHCPACGLSLNEYSELSAANLGGQYVRRTTFSPAEYYGLVDPNDPDELRPYIEDYLSNMREYDNE